MKALFGAEPAPPFPTTLPHLRPAYYNILCEENESRLDGAMVTRDTSNVEIHGSIPCQGNFFRFLTSGATTKVTKWDVGRSPRTAIAFVVPEHPHRNSTSMQACQVKMRK